MNPIALFAFNPGPITGDGNWTWLIRGEVPTLIDAGTGEARHIEGVKSALGGQPLSQVLVTHGHVDHASGAATLQQQLGVSRFLKMPWPPRDERWAVEWAPVHDNDVIRAGDEELVAIHTPGHAPDHLCFWHPASRTLFCGDLAIKGTSVWIPARLGGDLAAYLRSLERVLSLNPARLLPAHGPVIEDPESVLRGYIAHRREREEQVITALRAGDTTPQAIVARVYPRLADSLIPLAEESVASHLVKLQQEGRAHLDGDAWTIIGA